MIEYKKYVNVQSLMSVDEVHELKRLTKQNISDSIHTAVTYYMKHMQRKEHRHGKK